MKITKRMWNATTELLFNLQERVEDAEEWRADVNLARVKDGRDRLLKAEIDIKDLQGRVGSLAGGLDGLLVEAIPRRVHALEAVSHSPDDVTGAINGLRGGQDALLERVRHLDQRMNRRRDETTAVANDLRDADERLTEAQDALIARVRRLEEAQPVEVGIDPAKSAGVEAHNDQLRAELKAARERNADLQRAYDDAKADALDACSLRDKALSERDKAREGLKTVFAHADRIEDLEAALAKCETAESMADVRRLARAALGKVSS